MTKKNKTPFIAAKVNINQNIFSPDFEELIKEIPEAIKNTASMQKNSWTWQFTDVKEIDSNFLIGYLVQSKKRSLDVVKDNKVEKYDVPDPVANKSIFLYNSISEILIFEEGSINRDNFIVHFEQLIFNNNLKIGEIVVNILPDKQEVLKEIEAIEVLTKVVFNFIPPNGISKKGFKGIKETINSENAKRMKVELENKDGLNKDGDLINEGIEMISGSYGDLKAYGHKERNKKRSQKFLSKDAIEMKHFNKDDKDTLISKLKEFSEMMFEKIKS